MARPRTPTNILDARGAFKAHAGRRRLNEPDKGGDIGPAPAHLTDDELEAWNELTMLSPAGTFGPGDRAAVTMAAILYALSIRWITVSADDEAKTKMQVRAPMTAGERGLLIQLLSRFGLTPADRSRVEVPKKPLENPFSKLRNKK